MAASRIFFSAAAVGVVAALTLTHAAVGSDHFDVPGDPAADITDVYAWTSPDASHVNLVMGVFPNATTASKFSIVTLYAFRLSAYASATDRSAPVESSVICRFTLDEQVTCWGPGGERVTGDASGSEGLTSPSGKMRVFAGLRDDPFFHNRSGLRATVASVREAIPTGSSGCPSALEAQAPMFVSELRSDGAGGPAADDFKKTPMSGNVLAIVVSLDKSLVTDAGHPVLGVWASTNREGS